MNPSTQVRVLAHLPPMFVLIAALLGAQPRKSVPASPAPQVKLTLKAVDDATGAAIPNAHFVLTDFTHPVGDLFEGQFENLGEHVPVPLASREGQSSVMIAENSLMDVSAFAPDYPFSARSTSIIVKNKDLTMTISLTKGAVIVGQIVDAESRRPLGNIPVQARHAAFSHGIREFPYDRLTTKTDQGGRFEIRELRPGDYIVETNSSDGVVFQHIVPNSLYGRQAWPGGRDLADASPRPVTAGTTVDFGQILLRKQELPTVTVKVAGDCRGKHLTVQLTQYFATIRISRFEIDHVECGKVIVIPQVSPGLYQLTGQVDGKPGRVPDEFAAISLTVADTNISADLVERPPVDFAGRVLIETKDPVTGSRAEAVVARAVVIHLLATGTRGKGVLTELPSDVGAWTEPNTGAFTSKAYPPPGGRLSVWVNNLPEGLYVEALRYNGTRIDGDEFTSGESAAKQNLDIICSSEFGVVSGNVLNTEGGTVAVLFAPWPNDGGVYPSNVHEGRGEADGKFSIRPVRPGHYKAVAVKASDRPNFEAPLRLMQLLAKGLDVDIPAGPSDIRIEWLEH